MPVLSTHLSKFCSKSPHFFHFSEKTSRPSRQKGSPFAENSASPFAHFFHGSGVGEGATVGVAVGTGVIVGSVRGDVMRLPAAGNVDLRAHHRAQRLAHARAPRAQSAAWFQGFRHRRAQCCAPSVVIRYMLSRFLTSSCDTRPSSPLCPARPAPAAWLAAARCRAQAVCFATVARALSSKPDW